MLRSFFTRGSSVCDLRHAVNGHPLQEIPPGMDVALLAMGCFWGVERLFWRQPGVYSTAAGYTGGQVVNPCYQQVCSGQSGHAEAVRVVFDPAVMSYWKLLQLFWENHNPTQGARQGNDIGSQYRSALYPLNEAQAAAAHESQRLFRQAMDAAGKRQAITTEIVAAGVFYFAGAYHQQYLHKHPHGYCGLAGIGVSFPADQRDVMR